MRLKILLVLSLVAVNALVYMAVFAEDRAGIMTVHFLDVGQGDAIFIESPSGRQVLIDGGRGKGVLRELGLVMPFYDRHIDVIVETHGDLDHAGGLVYVRERLAHDFDISNDNTKAGTVIDLGDGVQLEVLLPDRDVANLEENSASLITKLTYGDTSFLLTGDAPRSMERYLVSLYGNALDVDVLKLGHHGSDTSTSEELLGFANPELAVISAGCSNSYGHPHESVTERLANFGVNYVSTCEEGSVVVESDGSSVSHSY